MYIYTFFLSVGNTTIPDVEFYDIETNKWFDAMPMNLNRSALSACVIAGLPNAKEYSYMCKFLHRSGMPDACWQGLNG